jgi:hypothetical protein
MRQIILDSYETRRQRLAKVMSQCPEIARHDEGDTKEAWTVAHSLLALEQSFDKVTRELLPKLEYGELGPDDVSDVLYALGEEFRHILYDIGDPKFFRYLPAWGGAQREE